VDPLVPCLRFTRSSCSDSIALRCASTSSLACARDATHVVSTGGTGGTPSDALRPRPPGLEFLVGRLLRIALGVDAGVAVIDLESDEWLPLCMDRPPREGECSWLDVGETGLPDVSPFLISSGVDKFLSAGMVSGLVDELPMAAELGVCTAPLDSVSTDEIEAPRSRLGTGGGAVCGVRMSEGRPRWLDRRACRGCLFIIAIR